MMKKLTNRLSALAIAVALAGANMSCSNDDNVTDEQTQAAQKVHVTVSAGIGNDDAATRAAVTQSGTTRTLTFTAGDRLYVTEHLGGTPTKYLAGYLDMVGSPSADGKSASFSGTLSVVLADGTPDTYDFGDADPLTSATEAWFVPVDAPAGLILDNVYMLPYNNAKMIAADVNSLMKSALYVTGQYDGSTKSFSLSGKKPILNCTIGGLSNNTEYTVKLRHALMQSYYESNTQVTETTYDAMTVTSDGDGFARFAISGLTNISGPPYNRYYVIQLINGGTTWDVILGQKELSAKVYNVTRNATFDHAIVTCQLRFSIFPSGVAGAGDITEPEAYSIVVSDPNGGFPSVTVNASGTPFTNGSTITARIYPTGNQTITNIKFRASGVSYYSDYRNFYHTDGVFEGTVEVPGFNSGGHIFDLGEVTLQKQ